MCAQKWYAVCCAVCCVMLLCNVTHFDDTGVQEINKTEKSKKKPFLSLFVDSRARSAVDRCLFFSIHTARGIFLFDFCGVFSAPEYSHTHTHVRASAHLNQRLQFRFMQSIRCCHMRHSNGAQTFAAD